MSTEVIVGTEPGVSSASATRLPLGRKLGYSAGQLVELIVGGTLNVFILFYATAVCGLPGGLAGLALGAGLVVDAILDPLIGSLSDGWRSRFGRRVPFMVVGLVPLVLTFNLIFALPATLSTTGLFLWLTLLSILLRVSLSTFSLPYQALGAELTSDYSERSALAAWRWGIGMIGLVAVIGLGYGVFFDGPGGLSRRPAYLMLTLTLSGLIVAGAFLAIRTGLATRELQRETAHSAQPIHHRLFGEIAEVVRNRTFRILFSASLLLHIAQGLNQALSLHLGVFFWGLDSEQMQAMMIAAVFGLVCGAPLVGPLGAKMEKRTLLIVGMIGLVTCYTVPPALRLFGLLPLSGASLTGFLVLGATLLGLMFALSTIAFISIIPDAADEHEYLFGARREGLYFAGWSFANKAAHGAGLLIAGVVLQLIHFPVNVADPGAAAVAIPERTLHWLGFAGGPGSGLLALLGAVIVLLYRGNRASHARITAELVARRGA